MAHLMVPYEDMSLTEFASHVNKFLRGQTLMCNFTAHSVLSRVQKSSAGVMNHFVGDDAMNLEQVAGWAVLKNLEGLVLDIENAVGRQQGKAELAAMQRRSKAERADIERTMAEINKDKALLVRLIKEMKSGTIQVNPLVLHLNKMEIELGAPGAAPGDKIAVAVCTTRKASAESSGSSSYDVDVNSFPRTAYIAHGGEGRMVATNVVLTASHKKATISAKFPHMEKDNTCALTFEDVTHLTSRAPKQFAMTAVPHPFGPERTMVQIEGAVLQEMVSDSRFPKSILTNAHAHIDADRKYDFVVDSESKNMEALSAMCREQPNKQLTTIMPHDLCFQTNLSAEEVPTPVDVSINVSCRCFGVNVTSMSVMVPGEVSADAAAASSKSDAMW